MTIISNIGDVTLKAEQWVEPVPAPDFGFLWGVEPMTREMWHIIKVYGSLENYFVKCPRETRPCLHLKIIGESKT